MSFQMETILNSMLLEPLLDLLHNASPGLLELRRVLWPLRVHIGAVRCPLDEDGWVPIQ